jgi:mannonate dehydratase
MQTAGISALAPSSAGAASKWPIEEGPATPKICLEEGAGRLSPGSSDEASMRRIKQLGVSFVLSGGPRIPWSEAELRARIDRLKAGGLTLYNLMIAGFPNTLYGRPGRDEEIDKVRQSIRVAGRVGLPVVEYNFYAHRLVEGYREETGRAGTGLTAFDYDKVRHLPPLPNIGAHSLEEMWRNITYFLKAVVPTAEEAGVRLALHPNDPPVHVSRGSEQVMATLAAWKRLIDIVPSRANGITFDCGVTKEIGEDPVEVCRYFGSRKRIHHVHFRNVRVRKPHDKYTEVAPDEGELDVFGVMKELVRQKYTGLIYPEHPRALDVDRETRTSSHFSLDVGAIPDWCSTSPTRARCCRRRCHRSKARSQAETRRRVHPECEFRYVNVQKARPSCEDRALTGPMVRCIRYCFSAPEGQPTF